MAQSKTPKQVERLRHKTPKRKNNPAAERQRKTPAAREKVERYSIERRNTLEDTQEAEKRDTGNDPQLIWRDKHEEVERDHTVAAPPCYTQEKISPRVLIEDLLKKREGVQATLEMFPNGNGPQAKDAEAYEHDIGWSNRMILGDSLQVMASLLKKDHLRGKVQCIYMDPPYGINFNSNFQVSTAKTTSKKSTISSDPAVIQAFRDTWTYGIHSYLGYLRDRLYLARDLLTESGSIFMQIGEENVHLVKCLLDEVFGPDCNVVTIVVQKKGGQNSSYMDSVNDYVLWYSRTPRKEGRIKYHQLYYPRPFKKGNLEGFRIYEKCYGFDDSRRKISFEKHKSLSKKEKEHFAIIKRSDFSSARNAGANEGNPYTYRGSEYSPSQGKTWKPSEEGMARLEKADRISAGKDSRRSNSKATLAYPRYFSDFGYKAISNIWTRIGGARTPVYVVQTSEEIIKRCILMASDPGDLVLDPTCGSGTTAFVAEQWGRRWITIDTSKVAITLARMRLMSAHFEYYKLADEGGDVAKGFVYEKARRITMSLIANNLEIDVIWKRHEKTLEPLRAELNRQHNSVWEKEWQIPHDAPEDWSNEQKTALAKWWSARAKRQAAIDLSIRESAKFKTLYDKPVSVPNIVRVAGPFTMESLSPHRILTPSTAESFQTKATKKELEEMKYFHEAICKNLRHSGVHFVDSEIKITFEALNPCAGPHIHMTGNYKEKEGRVAVFIGPQYGTVNLADMEKAKQVAESGELGEIDLLLILGFAFEAHAAGAPRKQESGLEMLRVNLNQDLQMAARLKGKVSDRLFVVIGEPDIEVRPAPDADPDHWIVEIKGIDFLRDGKVEHKGTKGIACWFVDTDYSNESFFVRHAYFLGKGKNDPYKKLKKALNTEINEVLWKGMHSAVSRPFVAPESRRIAVKAINHYGDEILKILVIPPPA